MRAAPTSAPAEPAGEGGDHPGERPYGRAMASGMVIGGITGGLSRLAALAATPLLVAVLGLSVYGFWSIAMVLVGSQSLIDLGLGTALVRYGAEAAHHRDARGLGRLMRLGLLGYAAVSAIFAAAVVPLAHRLPQWLGVVPAHRADAALLVYGSVVLFAVSNALVVVVACLQGLQRLDAVGWATLGGQCAYVGGVVLTWWQGWGVWGLLGAQLALYAVPLGWLSRLLAGLLGRWGALADAGTAPRPGLRALVAFGGRAQVVAAVDAAVAQLPRLVAAALLGSAAAGRVDLALRVPASVMGIPAQALLQPLLPGFARLRGCADAALALLARSLRWVASVLTPVAAALAVAGPDLVVRWLGDAGRGLGAPLRWAALGTLGYGLAGLANSAALGTGRATLAARWRLVLLALSLASYPTMAWRWGLAGLAAAFALSSCGVAALSLAQLARRLGSGATAPLRAGLASPLKALAVAGAASGLAALVPVPAGPRWAVPLAAGALAYAAAALPLGVLRPDEVRLLKEMFRKRRPVPCSGYRPQMPPTATVLRGSPGARATHGTAPGPPILRSAPAVPAGQASCEGLPCA